MRDGCNFDISKCFKDGKPLIIDGSHIDPECYIRQEHNPVNGQLEYRIQTDLSEDDGQNQALIAMQQKMREIDQSSSLIIPFLLTMDRVGHTQCLENRLSMLFQKNTSELPDDIDAFLEQRLDEEQEI